jgi:hypothetical protein
MRGMLALRFWARFDNVTMHGYFAQFSIHNETFPCGRQALRNNLKSTLCWVLKGQS